MQAAYGSWRSPVTAELLTRAGITLSAPDVRTAKDVTAANRIFWTEGRPSEDGRYVLVVAPDNDVRNQLSSL
jgi:hypothetical protein